MVELKTVGVFLARENIFTSPFCTDGHKSNVFCAELEAEAVVAHKPPNQPRVGRRNWVIAVKAQVGNRRDIDFKFIFIAYRVG